MPGEVQLVASNSLHDAPGRLVAANMVVVRAGRERLVEVRRLRDNVLPRGFIGLQRLGRRTLPNRCAWTDLWGLVRSALKLSCKNSGNGPHAS